MEKEQIAIPQTLSHRLRLLRVLESQLWNTPEVAETSYFDQVQRIIAQSQVIIDTGSYSRFMSARLSLQIQSGIGAYATAGYERNYEGRVEQFNTEMERRAGLIADIIAHPLSEDSFDSGYGVYGDRTVIFDDVMNAIVKMPDPGELDNARESPGWILQKTILAEEAAFTQFANDPPQMYKTLEMLYDVATEVGIFVVTAESFPTQYPLDHYITLARMGLEEGIRLRAS